MASNPPGLCDAIDVAGPWWALPATAVRADLNLALSRIFDLHMGNSATMAALAEASACEAEIQRQVRQLQQGSISQLTAHIRAGQEAGTVRLTLKPKHTAG